MATTATVTTITTTTIKFTGDNRNHTNDTGNVEITDAIIIFSWLFTGGAPPAAPSPVSPGYSAEECRGDPTDDALGCVSPSPVCQ